jgi:hypothetical protein
VNRGTGERCRYSEAYNCATLRRAPSPKTTGRTLLCTTCRTRGREMQIWFVSDGNGFQVVRFSDAFTAAHKDLFDDAAK